MPEYYTKTQIDEMGTEIGDRIKQNSGALPALGPVGTFLQVLAGPVLGFGAAPSGGGGAAFYLWCEESAGLAANSYEWSWGNGATGNDIGAPIMKAANLTHMSFNADAFGTSVQINARRATTPGTGSIVANPIFTSNNGVFELPVPILFNPGDTLVVQTGALVGSTSDARAYFRFEEV